MRRASLVRYRRLNRETGKTRPHVGASQETQHASGNDVVRFPKLGVACLVSSFVSTRSCLMHFKPPARSGLAPLLLSKVHFKRDRCGLYRDRQARFAVLPTRTVTNYQFSAIERRKHPGVNSRRPFVYISPKHVRPCHNEHPESRS